MRYKWNNKKSALRYKGKFYHYGDVVDLSEDLVKIHKGSLQAIKKNSPVETSKKRKKKKVK